MSPRVQKFGFLLCLSLCLGTCLHSSAADTRQLPPWQAMDYGPFLTSSIQAPEPGTNIAYKGIAINLGANFGGDHNEAIVFDTDLLRYSVGWTGDFVALKGVVFDGEHWAYPRIAGWEVFGNQSAPGWARAGSFRDPREHPYGPLPKEWAHWRGLYLREKKVVLSYSVGDMSVLEMPSLERRRDIAAFVRILNLGPCTNDNTLQLAFDGGRTGKLLDFSTLEPTSSSKAASACLAILGAERTPTGTTPAALEQALAGRWEFETTNALTADDQSPAKRKLALNGVHMTPDGHQGGALEFPGKQFVEIERPEDFDFLNQDISGAAWIRTHEDGVIMSHTSRGGKWVPDGKAFFVRGGKLAFDVGWVGAIGGSATVADGQWHHVGFTFSHNDGSVNLFVDGRLDASGKLKPQHAVANAAFKVGFGAPDFPASPWFRGRLDSLRLYLRALNSAEIAALAAAKSTPDIIVAAYIAAFDKAQWLATEDGNLRLQLPASANPSKAKVLLWRGPRERLPEFVDLVKTSPPPIELQPLTQGGPPRWKEKLLTHGLPGSDDGPYAIDTLTDPEQNPWHSWLRFGGVDFFPDGKRAALCTWNGDVWIVSGVDGDLRELTWQRIATGLFQPLGLKIVDGQIYVLGRDQITRLHDLNGDGEIDFYENFNNDCMTSEHFHEFALDLKLGPDGNFYYIKCACHGVPASHPHHGTLMRVSRDGSKLEVVARGLRAANGLGVGPRGEFTSIDNQGYWMPANRINWIQPGGWYGNQWAWNPAGRTNYDEPLCWMHNFVDRSGGTHLWVPDQRWGPLQDEIVTISYGMGHMFLLLKEQVNGQMQGAVTRFPVEFETGAMRGVFHPQNGQLYTCGLFGWAGNKTKPGGFYRVRYTGKPLHMANGLHFVKDGIVLGFTDPLDPDTATDPGNYDVTAWNYHWTANYGSPEFKLNGEEGRDSWPVQAVMLSADHRQVFLKIAQVQRIMQVHVIFKLKSTSGASVNNFVHGSIHNLNQSSGAEWLGPGAIAGTPAANTAAREELPGLLETFLSGSGLEAVDVRSSRLPALFVGAGTSPSPFLVPGPFGARWSGYLKADLNGERAFETEGRGSFRLTINGQLVLKAVPGNLNGKRSAPVLLRRGLNHFELEYQSPPTGDAEFRLNWFVGTMSSEPVPATAFVHTDQPRGFKERELLRHGRASFAEFRCAHCHKPAVPWSAAAMPELAADAPSLANIGDRLNESWLRQWLLNPKSIRSDALMPRVFRGDHAAIDAADVAAWLASLRSNPPSPVGEPVDLISSNSLLAGGKLVADLGCLACHQLPGEVELTNDDRVSLAHLGGKWRPEALHQFLMAPARHFAWTRMPDFKLTADEARAVAAFLLNRTSAQAGKSATESVVIAGNAAHGAELASTLGCLGCHFMDPLQNRMQAPALSTLAAGSERGCLATEPSAQGRSPEFDLSPEQRAALQRFLQNEFLPSLQHDTSAEFAERQYTALRCQACHARDNQTDLLTRLQALGPAPSQPNEDDEIGASRIVHVGRPLLTYAGEKLYSDWMRRLLDGSLPYKPRPQLPMRMPAFPAYASRLAEGLAQQHGYPVEAGPARVFDPNLAAVGRGLTGAADGFSCVSCHDVGSSKALAGKDTATVNFGYVADRLRPSYYWRYVQDPPGLVPGTMMPKFIGEDGTTPVKSVYNGDPKQQFTAIWHYLLSLQPGSP